jgi:hypothetical protein
LICSVALSFRFPPDPQNGFSVDELNPRQNMAFWDRDLLCARGKNPGLNRCRFEASGLDEWNG